MLLYLLYNDCRFSFVTQSGERFELNPQRLIKIGLKGAVVLANLNGEGAILLQLLHSYGMKPEIFGFKLNIIRLECGGVIFKDSGAFGIDLNARHETIIKELYALRILLQKLLNLSLYDRKVSSLSHIAALLMKKHCLDLAISEWEEFKGIFLSSYFGGRREVFSTLLGSSFDYPAMYARIQTGLFPLRFVHTNKSCDVQRYGLHKVKYFYAGASLAPRLPRRNADGSVTYSKGGVGWFWGHELLAFISCGGVVESLGECLVSEDLRPSLKRLQEYLMQERKRYGKTAKVISNSVYGRLALKPTGSVTKWRKFESHEIYDSSFYKRYKAYGDIVLFEVEAEKMNTIVPNNIAWASLITAIGRSEIMSLVLKCEREGVGVSKIATDCVFTEKSGEFIIDGKLFR